MSDWGKPVYCGGCERMMPLGVADNPELHKCGTVIEAPVANPPLYGSDNPNQKEN